MDISEIKPQESFETRSEGTELQQLNDATFEPGAYVEQTGDYRQSEAIQTSFTAVIETAVSDASLASQVAAGSSGGVIGTGGDQVGITPINLPRQADLASSVGGVKGTSGDQVGITPINLPRQADLASSAGGVAGTGGDQVGITPINLPRQADLASSAGGVAGNGADQVGITPINLPREANFASGVYGPGGDPAGEVASGGVRGPGGGDPLGGGMEKNIMGDIQTPIASPGDMLGDKSRGDIPVPLSPPARVEGGNTSIAEKMAGGKTGGEIGVPLQSPTSAEGGNVETVEKVGASQIVDSFGLRLNMAMDGSNQIEATIANIVKIYNNDNSDIMGM